MSLIFLKNDDRSVDANILGGASSMKPYRWSNYFTTPLKLAPNSQVAFIKSAFNAQELGDFEDATPYLTIGEPTLNIPIPLYMSESNVNNFTNYVNRIGRLANTYGSDGDFNHILVQPNQNPLGQATLQDFFQTGFNFIYKDDKKVAIRLTQRTPNDVFNQGFNNLNGVEPTISPIGINTGTGDNTTQFVENNLINLPPPDTEGLGSIFWDTPVIGNPEQLNFTFVPQTTPQFYNTNYNSLACGILGGASPSISPVVNLSTLFPYTFGVGNGTGGVFPCACSTTGIKKNIFMDAPPTANRTQVEGGGAPAHASVASVGSGGYGLIAFGRMPQNRANAVYDATIVPANRVGFTGLTPMSFGVQSADYMDLMYGGADVNSSRLGFNEVNDLNSAGVPQANPPTGSCDFRLAIGASARYMLGCDLQEIAGRILIIPKILDPQSLFVDSDYIPQPTLDLGELSAGFNTITGTAFQGGASGGASVYAINIQNVATAGRTKVSLNFRFRWTSPYTMCIEFCFSNDLGGMYDYRSDEPFLPSGANDDPTTGWCMLYDMKADPAVRPQYLFPSYFGDMRMVQYQSPVYRSAVGMKGYFDNRFTNYGGFRDGTNQNAPLPNIKYFYQPPDELGTPLVQDTAGGYTTPKLTGITPETFVATGTSAGYSQKQVQFLMNSLQIPASIDTILDELGAPIFQAYEPVNLHLGSQLGLITSKTPAKDIVVLNDNILGGANPFVEYGYDGSAIISSGNDDFTLHYQLTNFGIASQQGVKSTLNKTIMVVNKVELDQTNIEQNYNAYTYTHPTPLWIDLNNYSELNINGLDVLITDDNNNEAKILKQYTNLVVAFRAKPKRDEGYVPNNIPVVRNIRGKNAFGEPEVYYK
tara:strand:+ start:15234 stop:17852 length:2619 start_codon:yes stop_codon:yes gene_type:complete